MHKTPATIRFRETTRDSSYRYMDFHYQTTCQSPKLSSLGIDSMWYTPHHVSKTMKIKLDDDMLLYMIKILGVYLIIVLIPHLDTSQLSYATHVSEPIISIDPSSQYEKNETVSVKGWVKYNDQPASNVLILLRLTNPNSDEIFQDEIRSDLNGNFTSSIDLSTLNLTDIGAYRITAESQCRDEHRSICNHNTTSDVFIVTN